MIKAPTLLQAGRVSIIGALAGVLLSAFFAIGAKAQDAFVPPPPQPAPATAEIGEIVEADVSSRTIAVTSGFSGKEIIVFGSIHNGRQDAPDAGYYDVVVVVEGVPSPLVVRRKGNVAGLWMNTLSVNFDRVPSFYALSSTRPLRKIAALDVFADQGIGFPYIRITPRHPVPDAEFKKYRDAIIRLKKKDKLYLQDQSGVTFIGRSLFRSSVMLPANTPVGLLEARVYLFRGGKLLSTYTAEFQLEREGVERWLHNLAHKHSLLYGILAIIAAVSAGLMASEISRRTAR